MWRFAFIARFALPLLLLLLMGCGIDDDVPKPLTENDIEEMLNSQPFEEFPDKVREYNPSWSPDGTKIAFIRGSDIYVMNADGTNLVKPIW